jgi:hypothetical protein
MNNLEDLEDEQSSPNWEQILKENRRLKKELEEAEGKIFRKELQESSKDKSNPAGLIALYILLGIFIYLMGGWDS